MDFFKGLEKELNVTTTENGAKAYKSTLNKCLDLFGCLPISSYNEVNNLFKQAYYEDKETAIRILFWARDIRGGQGRRDVFRSLLLDLSKLDPKAVINLIPCIYEYGRWDDLFILSNSHVEVKQEMIKFVISMLKKDITNLSKGKSISLLGKWMPSNNASSKKTRELANLFIKELQWSPKKYRKTLVNLRKKLDIVEQKMCANKWEYIEYSHVPAKASYMYRNAFLRRDDIRYQEYLNQVEQGVKNIKAGTLYPYEIVKEFLNKRDSKTLELQWKALPNYIDKPFNGIVVADVSGSMYGTPLEVSISLAMYIAERNLSSYWKDKFITFSEDPKLETIKGNSLKEKIQNLNNSEWGYNTNLLKVFESILKAGLNNNLSQKDMPEILFIVSDMEFDIACEDKTNLEVIDKIFKDANYERPKLVFWNVRGNRNVPVTVDDKGTCLVSGCNPSILKAVLNNKIMTPLTILQETIYSSRYDLVGSLI